jgi:hypothetical protein
VITISFCVLAMHQLAVNHLFVAPATSEPHLIHHRPLVVEMQQVALTDQVPIGRHGQSFTFGPAGVDLCGAECDRTADCSGVVDHGSQVLMVSPVAENQSAMRAVAWRWCDSIQ